MEIRELVKVAYSTVERANTYFAHGNEKDCRAELAELKALLDDSHIGATGDVPENVSQEPDSPKEPSPGEKGEATEPEPQGPE